MDSRRIARMARAVLEGDFDFQAPSRRASSRVALFLAGAGAGVALGMLFSPAAGKKIRSNLEGRAREGFDRAKAKTQEFTRRAEENREGVRPPASEIHSGNSYAEKSSAS